MTIFKKKNREHLFGLYEDICVHCGKTKYAVIKEDQNEDVRKFLNYRFKEDKKSKKKFLDFFTNCRFKF